MNLLDYLSQAQSLAIECANGEKDAEMCQIEMEELNDSRVTACETTVHDFIEIAGKHSIIPLDNPDMLFDEES